MIRDLPEDGVVREPGAYRVPIDHYHSQAICLGPSISSGGLRTIWNQSPADFWAYSELNPDRYERNESPALAFGRAAHALLLGDEVFGERFAILPDSAPHRPTATQVKAAYRGRFSDSYLERVEFWEAFDSTAAGKTIVSETDMEHIRLMSLALAAHPLVGPLFDGHAEVSLIWQDEQTGVWIKARPDMLPRMEDVKGDLKTTADASLRAIMRDIGKHGYDMQAALGCVGCEIVLDRQITSDVMVFVQKSPPYHISPVEIPEDALHWGKLKCRAAINRFAECLAKGDWPGPVEGVPKYSQTERDLHIMGQDQGRLRAGEEHRR